MSSILRSLLIVVGVFGCSADRQVAPGPSPSTLPEPTTFFAPASLEFETQPVASIPSGSKIGTIRVKLLTRTGRPATGAYYNISLTLSSPDTSVRLTGITGLVTDTGVASFDSLVVMGTGKNVQLVAHSEALPPATSSLFNVIPGPPAALRFTNVDFYSGYGAGGKGSATVEVTDAAGNFITNAATPVTVGYQYLGSYTPTNADEGIFGTTTVPAVNGVATFTDLSFHRIGGYRLTASAPGLTAVTSGIFTIFPSQMTKLMFFTQPSNGLVNAPLPAFEVRETDQYGNPWNYPSTLGRYKVVMTLKSNPTGASLSGELAIEESIMFGITFRNVRVDKPGSGYTLLAKTVLPDFRDSFLELSGESAPFNIH